MESSGNDYPNLALPQRGIMRSLWLNSPNIAFRLGLRPLVSLMVWFTLASTIWLVCAFLFRPCSPLLTISPDNQRYFFSAAAQAIGAIGALVFVASFAAIQTTASRGVAAGILTFITCDPLLHGAMAFTLAGIIIPLYCTLIVPTSVWPMGLNAPGATVAFLPLVLVMVVAYALSIPRHSSPDRSLASMLQRLPAIADDTSANAIDIIQGTIEGYMQEFLRALDLGDLRGSQLAVARLAAVTRALYLQRSPARYGEDIHNAWKICAAQIPSACRADGVRDQCYQMIMQELSYSATAVLSLGSARAASLLQSILVDMAAAAVRGGYGQACNDYWTYLQSDMSSMFERFRQRGGEVEQVVRSVCACLKEAYRLLLFELEQVGPRNAGMRMSSLFVFAEALVLDEAPRGPQLLMVPVVAALKAEVGASLIGLGAGIIQSRPWLIKDFTESLRDGLEEGRFPAAIIKEALRVMPQKERVRHYASMAASALRPSDEPIVLGHEGTEHASWELTEIFCHVLLIQIQGWARHACNSDMASELADVVLCGAHSKSIVELWEAHWPSEDMANQVREYVRYLKAMKAQAG